MIQMRLLSALFALSVVPFLASAQPVVSNVNFAQQPDGFGSTQVVVNYDLVSDDGPSTVSLLYSLGSAPFELATAVGGDVGGGIDTGTGKEILWSVAEDIPSTESTHLIVRVLAEDGQPIELNISATVADGGLTNVPNQTMTFTFDEAVTGFTADDVTVMNATKGIFDGSGAVYTLDIIADGDGPVTVLVPAGAANSAVSPGIQNTASGIHTFDFNGSAPALDTVTITSDNANPEFAAEGDTITLSITSSRDITEPTVTISGSAANVSGSGNTYTATHIVQASDTEGTVLFSIDGFDDLYGNPGPNISSTTDASSVTIDTTAPTLDTVTITSNNANTSLAREGDMITVSMTASEAISAPTVTIAGNVATVSGSGSSYTASYTVLAGDSGPTAMIISGFADQAGNVGSTVSATTDASLVTIDTTAPTLNALTIASNNANTSFAREGDVITVSMTASEAISAPTVTIAGNAVTVFGSGGSYTASYTVQAGDSGPAGVIISGFADQAGNAGSTVSATTDASSVTMDTTAPTLDTVTIASNNAIASLARAGNIITVSMTASEAISPPTVTIAGNAATVTGSGAIYTASYMVQLMDTGAAAIVITDIADLAGNVGSSVSATTNSSSVTMDTTPPTINFRNPGSGATIVSLDSIVITFNEAVTNLNAGQLTVNGSPATSVTGSNPFTFSGFAAPNLGTVNVALIAGNTRDAAGNAFVGNSWSYQAEAVSLTITSTMAEDSVLRSQFQTLTFTFAKPVAGFNSGMVAVTGASKGTFTGSGSVYTLLLDNSGGLNEVEVAAKFPPDFPVLATFSNFYQDIWPITLPGGVRMDLYRIPAGSFMMGSPESEPGRGTNENQFEASFSQDFYMAKTLVTRQQWEALQSLPAPQSFTGPPTLPVHNVSHNDIQSWLVAFNNHITEPSAFGLPTEAQWEYAARAGTTTRFYFGDGISAIDDECALGGEREDNMWFCGNTSSLMAVGTKGPNPWGLDDMHGNLSEWVRDWFAPYPEEPMTNRFISQLVPYPIAPGIDGLYPFRMVRGGAWNSHARACRSAHRVSKSPETRDSNTGFRIIGVR